MQILTFEYSIIFCFTFSFHSSTLHIASPYQVMWGKKVLLVDGRTDPASDKVSVWSFDTEAECWSLLEAKGDIPVAIVRASANLIMFGDEDTRRRKLNDLHMFDLNSFTWLPLDCMLFCQIKLVRGLIFGGYSAAIEGN